MTAPAEYSYSFGGKVTKVSAKGPILNLKFDCSVEEEVKGGFKVVKQPSFNAELLQTDYKCLPIEGELKLFVGFNPKFAFYIPVLFELNIGFDVGAKIAAKLKNPLVNPYPPYNALEASQTSSCSKPHYAEADLFMPWVGNAGFSLKRSIAFELFSSTLANKAFDVLVIPKKLFSMKLPIEYKKKLLSACLWTEDSIETENQVPACRSERKFIAGLNSDPYLMTFDGRRFDCQARGEFILLKSYSRKFQINPRFWGPTDFGNVMNRIALKWANEPLLQIDAVKKDGKCDYNVFYGCSVKSLSEVTGKISARKLPGNTIKVVINPEKITITVRVQDSQFFSCFFRIHEIFIPESITKAWTIRELLGTPDNNVENEWISKSGQVLEFDGKGRFGEASYD